MNRRFEMMDDEISTEEKVSIVDHFTQQLVNSGYSAQKIKEIIVSSLKGIRRKEKRRKEQGNKYRSARETLVERMNKKLLEATTWYKDLKITEDTEEDKMITDFFKSTDGSWKEFRKKDKMGNNDHRKRKRKQQEKMKENKEENTKIQAVFFVAHTPYSEMAKRMRMKMENLEKLGKFKVKIVERAGNKVVDVLHKSNAWSLMDCERDDCLICSTESSKKGSCRQRNILYETFCITCKKKGEEKEKNGYENLEKSNQTLNIDDASENAVNDSPVKDETKNEVVKASKDNEANDTPVFVEAESNLNREKERKESKEGSKISPISPIQVNNPKNGPPQNIDDASENAVNDSPVIDETKNEVVNASIEVVHIPEGSRSPSLSSKDEKDIPKLACPNIYKKGVCPPLTELPPVIPNNLKRKREAELKERGGDDEDRDKERKEISNKSSYTVIPNNLKRKREAELKERGEIPPAMAYLDDF